MPRRRGDYDINSKLILHCCKESDNQCPAGEGITTSLSKLLANEPHGVTTNAPQERGLRRVVVAGGVVGVVV